MKYCRKCGTQLNDGAGFCKKCGAKQEESVKMPAVEENVETLKSNCATSALTAETSSQALSSRGTANSSGNKKWILIAAAVLAVVAVVAALLIKSKNKSDSIVYHQTELSADKSEAIPEITAAQTTETAKAEVTETAQSQTQAVAQTQNAPVVTSAAAEVSASKEDFTGFWTIPNGKIEVNIEKVGNTYPVGAYFHGGAYSGTEVWMNCSMQSGELIYTDGTAQLSQFSLDSQNTSFEPATIIDYSDASGRFYFVNNRTEAEKLDDVTILERENCSESDPVLIWEDHPPVQRKSDEYIIWYSSEIPITDYDMPYNKEHVRLARNEIYARYGRKFKSEDLQSYFNSKSWYRGTIEPDAFNENLLNAVEKENAKRLEAYENSLPARNYTVYFMSCYPYNGTGGLKEVRISSDGYSLRLEGVINGTYQTIEAYMLNTTRYLSSGGEDPDYDISKEHFLQTLKSLNGLGLELEIDGGSIIRARLCS